MTQQLQAERHAADARQRQQKLLDKMPGFIGMLVGQDHLFEYVNESFAVMDGKRELLGRPWSMRFPSSQVLDSTRHWTKFWPRALRFLKTPCRSALVAMTQTAISTCAANR
jgi:PAS domain-containing protein